MTTLTTKDLLKEPQVHGEWEAMKKRLNLAPENPFVAPGVSDTELREFFYKKEMAALEKSNLSSRFLPELKAEHEAKALEAFQQAKRETEKMVPFLHHVRQNPDQVVYYLTCPITGEEFRPLTLKDLVNDLPDGLVRTTFGYFSENRNWRKQFYQKSNEPYRRQIAPELFELMKNEWGFDALSRVDMNLLKHGDVVADSVNEVEVYLETTKSLVTKRTYVNTKGRYFKHKFNYTPTNVYLPSPPIEDVEGKLAQLKAGTLPDKNEENTERMIAANLLRLPELPDRALYDELRRLFQKEAAGAVSEEATFESMRTLLSEYRK